VRGAYTRCSFFRSNTNSSTSTANTMAATAKDAMNASSETPSCFCAWPVFGSRRLTGVGEAVDEVDEAAEDVRVADSEVEAEAEVECAIDDSAVDTAEDSAEEIAEETSARVEAEAEE
jgi:hypothetical protein